MTEYQTGKQSGRARCKNTMRDLTEARSGEDRQMHTAVQILVTTPLQRMQAEFEQAALERKELAELGTERHELRMSIRAYLMELDIVKEKAKRSPANQNIKKRR